MSHISQSRSDTQKIGSSFKQLGIAIIVVFGLTILITIIFISSLTGIVNSGISEAEFNRRFISSFRTFLYSVLLISLITVFFYFRIYLTLTDVKSDDELFNEKLHQALQTLLIVLVLQVIGFVYGLISASQIINEFESFLNGDLSIEEIEESASDLENDRIGLLLNALLSVSLFVWITHIKAWLDLLADKNNHFGYKDSANGSQNIRIGYGILATLSVISFLSGQDALGFLGFIGTIFVIVGLFQLGGRMQRIGYNYQQPPYSNMHSSPDPYPFPTETRKEDKVRLFCTQCGSTNNESSFFCVSCGYKLKN